MSLERPRISQPAFIPQADLGPGTGRDGLAVAPPHAAAHRIHDADRRIADLMEPTRHLRRTTIGDSFAVDMELPAELAVVMPVEAEVQTSAQLDAGVAQHFDREGSLRSVLHGREEAAAEESPIDGIEP